MLSYFLPDLYINNVHDLPLDFLKNKKIDTLVFDIDNTLVPYYTKEPTNLEAAYIKALISKGFKVALLSNNSKKRVLAFNNDLSVVAVWRAAKPFKYGIKKALRQLNSSCDNTAIIGDQLFTDVWCGKKTGVFTVLVVPITNAEGFLIRLKRKLERAILKRLKVKSPPGKGE